MSALKSSRFKRVLLFAVAGFAIACVVVPAQADPESAAFAALRTKAEKGNGIAQYNLGLAYVQGREVPVDLTEAFIWLSLAAENGTTGKALESVVGKLTTEQLADSQRRLNERRIALSSTPAAPAAGATRVGGAVKTTTGGFNLGHPATIAVASPDDSAPKAAAAESQPSKVPPPAAPPTETAQSAEPTHEPTPVAATGPDLRDPSSGLLQVIGTLRNEKQQLGIELAQARRELEKTQAHLADTNAEVATLQANIARLEASFVAAKLTETRLTVELSAARQELGAAKPPDAPVAAEKPKADDHPPHSP